MPVFAIDGALFGAELADSKLQCLVFCTVCFFNHVLLFLVYSMLFFLVQWFSGQSNPGDRVLAFLL